MKQKLLIVFGVMIISISCQKQIDDFREDGPGKKFDYNRFFPESQKDHPAIKRIFSYLKNEHSKKDFLSNFVEVAGYPRWDKILLRNDSICIIPLVSENNTAVTGMLIAELLGDGVKCRYNLLSDYRKIGQPAKAFVLSMIQFEKHVFGHTSFKIYDHSLLGSANTIVLRKRQQQTPSAYSQDDPCEIVEIWHDPTEEQCHCSGDEYYTGEWYYDGDCFGSPGIPYMLPLPGGSSYTLPGLQAGPLGGNGGPNSPPYASSFTEKLNYLLNHLDMTPESSDFLPTSEATVNEMYNYLYNSASDERIEIASDHIQRMAIDPGYLSFVTGYRTSTGNSITPWWENQGWLSNAGNFNLDITQANGHYDELNEAERILVQVYPLQAYIISRNIDIATSTAEATGLPGELNGKQDAFRHAFFQALNARDVPPRIYGYAAASTPQIVSMFAIAHESEVPSVLHLEREMDIFNNNVGISYCWNCWGTSNNTIRNGIMNKLNNGELRYIKPLDRLLSHLYDENDDGVQDCPTCLNGILPSSILAPTNQ